MLAVAWMPAMGLLSGVPPLTTMDKLAPVLRADSGGYIVALEGLVDARGAPLVYVHGLPFGTAEEVCDQIRYAHERSRACCSCADGDASPRVTTVVNVRAPSFRFPDKACLAAIRMTKKEYAWTCSGESRTIFVACPSVVVWAFRKLRHVMSAEQYKSISFVDRFEDLDELGLPSHQRPQSLGGSAAWELQEYVRERCEAEGVFDPGGVRRYAGTPIDWALLDRHDEKQRQKQRKKEEEQAAATAALSADAEEEEEARGSNVFESAAEDEADGDMRNILEEVVEEEEHPPRRRWRERVRGVVVGTRQRVLSRRAAAGDESERDASVSDT